VNNQKLDAIVKAAVDKSFEKVIAAKRAVKTTTLSYVAKAQTGQKISSIAQIEKAAVQETASVNTVKALPTPTSEQVKKAGGGVLGFIKARRELQQQKNG